MDQEKIGKFIKDLRIKNNLTQKEFADKYNVTYQAVSKWENGKNMPDLSLLKEICKDFDVSLDDLFNGEKSVKKSYKKYVIIGIICIVIVLFLVIKNNNNGDFSFKTITSSCDAFNISGSIAYNDKKSAIYITNIKYCGGDDTKDYEIIECTLYESHGDIEKKISSYKYDGDKKIKLEKFLENVTFKVDGYKKTCDEHNSLYLLINATDDSKNITTYKVPLETQSICAK
ncbi:XRE family transcriptional regulator [bacterium]|nr:XRE family transcriptional regulator [bacterium]